MMTAERMETILSSMEPARAQLSDEDLELLRADDERIAKKEFERDYRAIVAPRVRSFMEGVRDKSNPSGNVGGNPDEGAILRPHREHIVDFPEHPLPLCPGGGHAEVISQTTGFTGGSPNTPLASPNLGDYVHVYQHADMDLRRIGVGISNPFRSGAGVSPVPSNAWMWNWFGETPKPIGDLRQVGVLFWTAVPLPTPFFGPVSFTVDAKVEIDLVTKIFGGVPIPLNNFVRLKPGDGVADGLVWARGQLTMNVRPVARPTFTATTSRPFLHRFKSRTSALNGWLEDQFGLSTSFTAQHVSAMSISFFLLLEVLRTGQAGSNGQQTASGEAAIDFIDHDVSDVAIWGLSGSPIRISSVNVHWCPTLLPFLS